MEALRRVKVPNHSQCWRISVLYTVAFLLYSYFHSTTSRLFQFAFAVVIFKSVHESMKRNRHSELRINIYDVFQLLSQLIGDTITIPYDILFNSREKPHIYFQRNARNISLIRNIEHVLNSYAPTPILKNAIVQFSRLCFYEESPISWSSKKGMYHIKRECITLEDEGLIALDWWIKPSSVKHKPLHFNYCTYCNERNYIQYKSNLYYQYDPKLYTDCFRNLSDYPQGAETPLLLVFGTFAGDSLSAPTQLVCDYFVQRNWRVVVYVKRGCGSFTQREFLPLNTLKAFCLRGESDYDVVIKLIQKRFPLAPKMLLGLSLGGAYIQTILGNKKYDGIFCGGIKIDAGMDYKEECKDLDKRQPLIGLALAQIFKDQMIKCKDHKLKHGILEDDPYYKRFKWDEIAKEMKNKEQTGLMWSIRRFVSPSSGYDDVNKYLDWVKPGDLENIRHVPLLILDSWNDFMRNRKHILKDFSKRNENIIHVINERGAHCMRREGFAGNKCWISKIAFAFSNAVIHRHLKHCQ